MTLETATKPYALARANMQAMLAASTTFQTWVGAADAAAALERIHLSAVPPPADGEKYSIDEVDALLPMAVIWTKVFLTKTDSAYGSGIGYQRGSDVIVDLFGPVDLATSDVPAECGRKIDNVIGGVLSDLEDLNSQAGYLAWRQILIQEEPERGAIADQPTRGDTWRIRMVVSWLGI